MFILDVEELETVATLHQQAIIARRKHQSIDTPLPNDLREQTTLAGCMEQVDMVIG